MTAQILVVDDEPSVIDVLTRFLRREGYNVSTASNGREALDKVQQEAPDLILLDVVMPIMDGFAACQRLKEDPQTALIPIVFLSGLDEPEYRTQGIEAGADDYLTHPFDKSRLAALSN
jgi:CheY-like chemotaxis protein